MPSITTNPRTKGDDGYVYDRRNVMTAASYERWATSYRGHHPILANLYIYEPRKMAAMQREVISLLQEAGLITTR